MALEPTRYGALPLAYFNAINGLCQLVEDKIADGGTEEDQELVRFHGFIATALADTLEQQFRHEQFGGHLPEWQQYATPDAFVPVIPHDTYADV